MQRNKFEQFLQHRHSLLIQYRMGDLTKNEFITESYNYLESLDISPFERVDNIKKALYNYHYHNVKAKYWQRLSQNRRFPDKERQAYYDESIAHYREKDNATLKLLRLIDFKNMEAFRVHVRSEKLRDRLIEIVIRDPDVLLEVAAFYPMTGAVGGEDLILHTRSEMIARILTEQHVFSEEKRQSLTDGYINQRY